MYLLTDGEIENLDHIQYIMRTCGKHIEYNPIKEIQISIISPEFGVYVPSLTL